MLEDPISESEDEEIDYGNNEGENDAMEVDDPVSPPHFAGDLYGDVYEPDDFPGFEGPDLSEGQVSDDEALSGEDFSDDEYK